MLTDSLQAGLSSQPINDYQYLDTTGYEPSSPSDVNIDVHGRSTVAAASSDMAMSLYPRITPVTHLRPSSITSSNYLFVGQDLNGAQSEYEDPCPPEPVRENARQASIYEEPVASDNMYEQPVVVDKSLPMAETTVAKPSQEGAYEEATSGHRLVPMSGGLDLASEHEGTGRGLEMDDDMPFYEQSTAGYPISDAVSQNSFEFPL